MDPINLNKEAQEFIESNETLRELAKNEPSVYAWAQMYLRGKCTQEEMLVGALAYVVREKKEIFEELVKTSAKSNFARAKNGDLIYTGETTA